MDIVAGAVGSIVSKLGELLQAEFLKKQLECAHGSPQLG